MKINELEELLGVSRATIRYYENQGLVTPPRTENGYRDYGDEEARLFQKIIVLRKLGVGVPEIKDLIENKAELHDVLEQNVDRLRTQQDEIAVAIEMCGDLDAEAGDFDEIDPPKYLKSIYEAEENGKCFAETKEISPRDLNLAVTLIGAMAGIAIPQNNRYSKHANSPIPADIRANKEEGDEYDTIGDVLKKGGIRKPFAIAAISLLLGFLILNGAITWLGLGGTIKSGLDYNKSGISAAVPDDEELARLASVDSEVVNAAEAERLLKYHTRGNLLLTLKGSKGGKWIELDRKEISANEGYVFATGDPSSEVELHVIADDKSTKSRKQIFDKSYTAANSYPFNDYNQHALGEEQAIIFFVNGNVWPEEEYAITWDLFDEVLTEEPPDGYYAVFAHDLD